MIPALALSALVVFALAPKTLYSQLKIKFSNISISKARTKITNLGFDVKLKAENPTDKSARIENIKGVLFYQTTPLATIDSKNPINIAAKTKSTLILPLNVNTLRLGSNILKLINGDMKLNAEFTFKGTITADGKTQNVTEKITF